MRICEVFEKKRAKFSLPSSVAQVRAMKINVNIIENLPTKYSLLLTERIANFNRLEKFRNSYDQASFGKAFGSLHTNSFYVTF